MPDSIPSQCAPIASEVEDLEQERAGLQQELAEAPPSLKPVLLREIRKIGLELARKRQELHECVQQDPPPPRPDLFAKTVILNVNHATRRLGVAAVIRNIGRGNARGPLKIDFGVTLFRGGGATTFFRTFEVPAGITIFGEPVLAPPEATDIPGPEATAISGPGGVTPSREYVTERMDVPLHYIDENPSSRYEFEFIVDAEQVVAETSEANNHFKISWFTGSPQAVQRDTAFVIESSESS
jgi:hypothetical protein